MKNKISKSLTQRLVEQGVKPQQIIDQVSGKFVGYGFVFDNVILKGKVALIGDSQKITSAAALKNK